MVTRNVFSGLVRTPRLRELGPRLGEWWLREAFDLLPSQVAKLLSQRGRLFLAVGNDLEVVTLEILDNKRRPISLKQIGISDYSPGAIDRLLELKHLRRDDVEIGVRLRSENIFTRRFMLPAEAGAAIHEIAVQNLSKRTPFRSDDIYSGHVAIAGSDSSDKFTVWQWITKRKYVRDAILALQLDLAHIAFITADKRVVEDGPLPFINLRENAPTRRSLVVKAAYALSCMALVLAVAAGGLTYWRQQMTLDGLSRQIATVKVKAQEVRTMVDRLQERRIALARLRLRWTESPGLIDMWEEVTRVLPSHTWLSELRLIDVADTQEQQVSIIGLSAAAPGLVAIFDSSPLFSGAALTAPVALDSAEGRERFALQAKVKKPEFTQGAAR